jgi:hypothetical protein
MGRGSESGHRMDGWMDGGYVGRAFVMVMIADDDGDDDDKGIVPSRLWMRESVCVCGIGDLYCTNHHSRTQIDMARTDIRKSQTM